MCQGMSQQSTIIGSVISLQSPRGRRFSFRRSTITNLNNTTTAFEELSAPQAAREYIAKTQRTTPKTRSSPNPTSPPNLPRTPSPSSPVFFFSLTSLKSQIRHNASRGPPRWARAPTREPASRGRCTSRIVWGWAWASVSPRAIRQCLCLCVFRAGRLHPAITFPGNPCVLTNSFRSTLQCTPVTCVPV